MLEEPFQRKARDNTALQKDLNDKMTLSLMINDMSEIHSPPRVVRFTKEFNLVGGWSLDLTVVDDEGEVWDFSKPEMLDKALELVWRDPPSLVIDSPMCTNCSIMMNLNWSKTSLTVKERRLKEARAHLTSCLEVCKIQHQEGRCFLHGHPMSATSREGKGAINLAGMSGVIEAKTHVCRLVMLRYILASYAEPSVRG